MKYFILSLFAVAVMGCSSGESASTEESNSATETTEYAYQCPMQCEGSGSDSPGKCSVCKMDLVEM